MVKKNEGFLVI